MSRAGEKGSFIVYYELLLLLLLRWRWLPWWRRTRRAERTPIVQHVKIIGIACRWTRVFKLELKSLRAAENHDDIIRRERKFGGGLRCIFICSTPVPPQQSRIRFTASYRRMRQRRVTTTCGGPDWGARSVRCRRPNFVRTYNISFSCGLKPRISAVSPVI